MEICRITNLKLENSKQKFQWSILYYCNLVIKRNTQIILISLKVTQHNYYDKGNISMTMLTLIQIISNSVVDKSLPRHFSHVSIVDDHALWPYPDMYILVSFILGFVILHAVSRQGRSLLDNFVF